MTKVFNNSLPLTAVMMHKSVKLISKHNNCNFVFVFLIKKPTNVNKFACIPFVWV